MSESVRIVSDPLGNADRTARQEKEEQRRRSRIEHNGQVLEVPGHGRVRKVVQELRDADGRPTVHYYADSEGYSLILAAGNDLTAFDHAVANHDLVEIRDTPELLSAEFERFRSSWPFLAAVLEPLVTQARGPAAAATAVPLGARWRPRTGTGQVTEPRFREYLLRHAGGDFGDLGRLDAVTLTDVARAAPELHDIATRNAVALEAGSGVIRSRFRLPDALAEGLSPAYFTYPTGGDKWCVATVDIGTKLAPGQAPVTVCLLGTIDKQCFGA